MFPLILGAAELALKVGSSLAGASAQNKAAKANRNAANIAFENTVSQINVREGQETDAATQTILSADRQARAVDAKARVAAGEAGVAGASVDALLAGILRDKLDFTATTERNLSNTVAQLETEKLGAAAARDSRVASTPGANPLLSGLQIGGALIDFGTDYWTRTRPAPAGTR